MCYFKNLHNGHKLIDISEIKSLEKENIKIEEEIKELNEKNKKLISLKEKIEEEINKINKQFIKTVDELNNSYEEKISKIMKQKSDLEEKLKTEVTKSLEQLEIILSEINDELHLNERFNKGLGILEKEEKNTFKTLSFVSKVNKSKKNIDNFLAKFMRNITLNFSPEKNDIIFEEYFFNGIALPKNIEIKNITSSSASISWTIDEFEKIHFFKINNKNYIQYLIELRKENDNFEKILFLKYKISNCTIYNLENNTNYEIRIRAYHDQSNFFGEYSSVQKFKTLDYQKSIILRDTNKEEELMKQLKEWINFKDIKLLFRHQEME